MCNLQTTILNGTVSYLYDVLVYDVNDHSHKTRCDGYRPCGRCVRSKRPEMCTERVFGMEKIRTRGLRRPRSVIDIHQTTTASLLSSSTFPSTNGHTLFPLPSPVTIVTPCVPLPTTSTAAMIASSVPVPAIVVANVVNTSTHAVALAVPSLSIIPTVSSVAPLVTNVDEVVDADTEPDALPISMPPLEQSVPVSSFYRTNSSFPASSSSLKHARSPSPSPSVSSSSSSSSSSVDSSSRSASPARKRRNNNNNSINHRNNNNSSALTANEWPVFPMSNGSVRSRLESFFPRTVMIFNESAVIREACIR
jgi:hypothetical protein